MGGRRTGRPVWASENTTGYNTLVHRVHLSQRFHQLLRAIAVHTHDAGPGIRWRVVRGLRVNRRDDPTSASRKGGRPGSKQLGGGRGGGGDAVGGCLFI